MMTDTIKVESPTHPTLEFVELSWDNDSPMDVGLTFIHGTGEEVTWVIGRDFLVEALKAKGSYGEGDIKIFDNEGPFIKLTLFPGAIDPAVIPIPRQRVTHFIDATIKLSPLGEENLEDELDEALAEILG